MWKKIASLMLALVIGLLLGQTAVVAESNNETSLETQAMYIHSTNTKITLNAGTATCSGNSKALYTDTTTHLLMMLQRRAVGSNTWLAVYTWTTTASGTATARINQTRAVSSGYDYRTFVRCTIKDADGVILETQSAYSNIVTY